MVEYRVGFEAISHLSIETLSQDFYSEFDGVLVERDGRLSVFVYVDGSSPVDAGWTAITRLEHLGFSICRTDLDLVDGPEIASRLDVTRQAVQNWAKGTRGASFPRPIGSPGGKRVWAWGQIAEWARRERGLDEPLGPSLDDAAMLDAWLAQRRRQVARHPVPLAWAIGKGSMKSQAGLSGIVDYTDSRPVRLTDLHAALYGSDA